MNKTFQKLAMLALPLSFLLGFSSCENGDKEFDDYDYQTVYFAQQTPIRTITLGTDDDFPNDLDNAHECQLQVVVGGYGRTIRPATLRLPLTTIWSTTSPSTPLTANHLSIQASLSWLCLRSIISSKATK